MLDTYSVIQYVVNYWIAMVNKDRRFKTAIYEQFARIGKAIANPGRLELLDLLCQGPRTVEILAKEAGLGLTNASQQLKLAARGTACGGGEMGLLSLIGWRTSESASFSEPCVHWPKVAWRRLGISRRFMETRRGLEPVDREQLLAKVRDGAVTVLDVRPPKEFRAGHLPGALSVPLKDLERRLSELPRDREIVAYCRGLYSRLPLKQSSS